MENLLLIITLAALVGVERVPSLRFTQARVLRPFFATDLLYFGTGVALAFAMRDHATRWVGHMGMPALESLPFLVSTVLATVLYDLGAYVSHVLLHASDALWAVHKVHHSSRMLDWLATFRGHIIEHTLRHLASPVLLILIGFPLPAVGSAAAVYGAWAAFIHANIRLDLRRLEPVFITPRLHRLHHVPETSAYNLGTILSLWDRVRGTLVTDPAARLEPIGVPGAVETYPQRWLPQLVEPLRSLSGRPAGTGPRRYGDVGGAGKREMGLG